MKKILSDIPIRILFNFYCEKKPEYEFSSDQLIIAKLAAHHIMNHYISKSKKKKITKS